MRRHIMRAMTHYLLILALCAATLVACTSPKMTFHTLGVDTRRALTASKEYSRFKSVGVGPITLPALLEQPDLVVRKDNYTVELSETHAWGGKLDEELLSALTRYLRHRLANAQVISVPWETAQKPQIQLAISLDRFDGAPKGEAVLRGTWVLQDPTDGRAISVHQVLLKEKVKDDNIRALVEAQSKLVVRLGEQVLKALR